MVPRALRADAFASVSRILDAARKVFATGDGTGTLNRIAQEAGVGIATLYRHFPNRETLARAVYDRIFTKEVQPLIDQFERADAPRDVLLDLAERLLDVLSRERGLARSLENVAETTSELLRAHSGTLETAVVRAQAAGKIRADLMPSDIPALIAMMAAGFAAIDTPGDMRRRYLSLLLDGLNPPQAQPLPKVP